MATRICLDAATPVFGPEGLVLPRFARTPPWPPPSLSLLCTQQLPLGYLGFAEIHSIKNSCRRSSVCETPTCEINHSSAESLYLSCVSFEFLLVFFVALAGISLLGEVNRVVTWLITRGVVVLRLLDSGLRI